MSSRHTESPASRWFPLENTAHRRIAIISTLLAVLLLPGVSFASGGDDTTTITLRFAGDCLLGGHYEQAAGQNVSLAFEGFDLFHTADISVVNLENPVTTRGQKVLKPWNFRMHPRFLRALTDAGIGLVSIANNHIFDYGDEGLFDTFSYLDSARMCYIGAGRNAERARRPYIRQTSRGKIGVLAYYGGGEAPAATKTRAGVAPRELGVILADLRTLRQRDSVEFAVVVLHWGTELAQLPDGSQRAFARALIDAGANAVIGHHPHVLQGIESYHSGVIVYSLGNFVFGGNSRHTYDTGVFEIQLTASGPAYRLIPVGLRNWRLSVLTDSDSARVIDRVRGLSREFPSSIFTQ